jgi:hypothetical protein
LEQRRMIRTNEWLDELTQKWTSIIRELALVAKLYPQSAYCGLNKSFQQEWQFVRAVILVPGDTLI